MTPDERNDLDIDGLANRNDDLEAECRRLRAEVGRHETKWREYESDYILPVFAWAEQMGLDLREHVKANAGKNCVVLFFEWLRAKVLQLEGSRENLLRQQVVLQKQVFALTAERDRLAAENAELRKLLGEFVAWQQNKTGVSHRCVQYISRDSAALLAAQHQPSSPNVPKSKTE